MTAAEQFRKDYEEHLFVWSGLPDFYRRLLDDLLASHLAAVEARMLGLETAEIDSPAMQEYLRKRVRSEVTR